MARYSDEIIDEIRNRNDIVDVISQYVVLKRSGRNFFGLCPFHKEKSPSFSVSPDKQIFHCFGCGEGGNVFHFISKIENISFPEALETLADRAGVELPVLDSDVDSKQALLKSKVYEINKCAADFYHENLYKPTAKVAQEYVKQRKLDNNTLKSFLIGYSGNFDELYNILKEKGFSEEEILASGLVNKNEKGQFIDRFRKRLMFPIQDIRGRVIAFGGRVLMPEEERKKLEESGKKTPKYINSQEGIVYSKGRHLYGLNVARKFEGKMKRIIIVEGYMDAISLHQRGIHNAVASLGTAMTEAQGHLLRNNSEQVIIGYDSDGAGQAATQRGLDILQSMGCDVRVLQMDRNMAKDPDEFVVKYGPERFQKLVEKSISLVEYKVKVLSKDLDLQNANDKIKFLKEIAKVLSKLDNNIEKEVYAEKISKEYQISKEAIYAEINKIENGNNKGIKVLEKNKPKMQVKTETIEDELIDKREKLVIYLLINYPNESYAKIRKNIDINDLKSERNQNIVRKLYDEIEKGNSNINNVLDWFEDGETINYLSWILAYDFEITEVNKAISDLVNIYTKENLIKQRNEIIKQLEKNDLSQEESNQLEKMLNEIIIKLAKMK